MPWSRVAFSTVVSLPILMAALPATAQVKAFSNNSADAKPPPMVTSNSMVPSNTADMQAVLDSLTVLGVKPIETLTPDAAREQPTPADAVKRVLKQKGMPTEPDPSVTTSVRSYGPADKEEVTIYRPKAASGPLPVVVYYHGGGWVIANVKAYDATPRYLAAALPAIVVSVEYRLAPEFKFPAQHEDAATAYQWVLKNAKSFGGDTSHIALAGESAGGNLAVATAIYARDHHLPAPAAILSVYPIANSSPSLPSRAENGNTKPLDTAMLIWFTFYYAKDAADVADPRIDLVHADLHGLPPTTIINAQNDPLRSDGETLAAAMRAAGDKVTQKTYLGVTHEFFGMGKVVQGAMDANRYAVAQLKPAL